MAVAESQWTQCYALVVDCNLPPDVVNGRVVMQSGTTFGSTATYECDDGLKFTRTCLATGNWSNERRCGEPANNKPHFGDYYLWVLLSS